MTTTSSVSNLIHSQNKSKQFYERAQTESKPYWPFHTDPGNTPPALLQPNPARIPPSRHKNVTEAIWGRGPIYIFTYMRTSVWYTLSCGYTIF